MAQRSLEVTLETAEVPQHRSLADVVQLVRSVRGVAPAPELSKRHLGYCRQAAEILGLLDSAGALTDVGREVALATFEPNSPDAMKVAAERMNRTAVFQCWLRWSGASSLDELDPDTALPFLLECTTLSPSTGRHRAAALKRWLEQAVPAQLELEGLGRDAPPADPSTAPHNESATVWGAIAGDLRSSGDVLFVTGYASLDRLVLALNELDPGTLRRLRIHVGSEPFPGREAVTTEVPTHLARDVRRYWLARGVSLFNARRWLDGMAVLDSDVVEARLGAQDRRMVHAKVLATDRAVVMGSSNFTTGGLERNHEINARWTDRTDERAIAVRAVAESIWNRGLPYTDELRRLAAELLRVVGWREAVARAVAAVLEGSWAKDIVPWDDIEQLDPPLWPHQKEALARMLWLHEVAGLVLVADPAGSGKTRLGAWAFRMVHQRLSQERGIVRNPVVVCPKAVRAAWRECLREASISAEVFPDSALSQPISEEARFLEKALTQTDLVLLDEAHRYLNQTSRRTRRLLAAGPEHLLAFTATPLNREARDFMGVMELLGPDRFDDDTVSAVERIARASDDLEAVEPQIELVREAFQDKMIRRTRADLVEMSRAQPEGYRLRSGRIANYPRLDPEWYELPLSVTDELLLGEIRAIAAQLTGIHRVVAKLAMSERQRRLGWSNERYLRQAVSSAAALARYSLLTMLRSSRVAAYAHVAGVTAASEVFGVKARNRVSGGNTVATLRTKRGEIPRWELDEPAGAFDWLPPWLSDPDAHIAATTEEAERYRAIAARIARMSDAREDAKAALLAELAEQGRVLAFDHHVFTLLDVQDRLRGRGVEVQLATGMGTRAERRAVLREFGLGGSGSTGVALLSDALNEGVNLQGASATVHLDWPTVIRVAEQRTGRIDRMDSEHEAVRVLWPRERGQLGRDRSERRLFQRNELVRKTLGANLVLPDEELDAAGAIEREDDRPPAASEDDAPDAADLADAFGPVRALVGTLIERDLYDAMKRVDLDITACVSSVPSAVPWAFFCVRSLGAGAPLWIAYPSPTGSPSTGLRACAAMLSSRLGATTADHALDGPAAEILERFAERLDADRDALLPPRQRHTIVLMRDVLAEYEEEARRRNDRHRVQVVTELQRRIHPGPECTWLTDAARAFWRALGTYRLRHIDRRLKRSRLVRTRVLRPMLLDDPLSTAALEQLLERLRPQVPPSERALAVIVGVTPEGQDLDG